MENTKTNENNETNSASGNKVKNRTIYYHRYSSDSMSYGGTPPLLYKNSSGGSSYGSTVPGSVYGSEFGNVPASMENQSANSMNIARILRVCLQHWMTIFVFFILGVLGSLIVYQLLPLKYTSTAVFEMSVMQKSVFDKDFLNDGVGGSNIREVFNTRLELLRSPKVVKLILDRYRSDHASSAVSQEELIEILEESEMKLVPMSRLIELTIDAGSPTLAADLANAYARTCEAFMHELNKENVDSAVEFLMTQVDNQERVLAQVEQELMDLRKARNLDAQKRDREEKQIRMAALNSQIITFDTQITRSKELSAALKTIKDDPEKFGMLPESIPRSSEIANTFAKLQEVQATRKTLLTRFTESHPDVKLKVREEEVYQKQFEEAVIRANDTATAELEVLIRQREPIQKEAEFLNAELVNLDTEIISTEMRLSQLERRCEIEREKSTQLRTRMSALSLQADENAAVIKQVSPARVPESKSSPKPFIVFPAGILFGIFVGSLFVLLLDHMEDKLIGVADIEQRLRLKVLAIFPHLRRKQRQQVALTMHTDPFSQYAESMAGLRNLLDSPRYHDLTQAILLMSTQPAEGKTSASTNLAISYAQSGQRTLLVDFDMRRPRLATIFNQTPNAFESLPHVLARNDATLFNTLPVKTDIPSLDLVLSRASFSISPSVLMGTNIITEFFDWARKNYDRIIIDSPPFGLVGDVIVLANLVDSVLLVATPDKSRFGPIRFATNRLNEVGARLLGVIMNDVDFGSWAGFGNKYEVRYGYSSTYAPRGDIMKETTSDLVFSIDGTSSSVASTAEDDETKENHTKAKVQPMPVQVPESEQPLDNSFIDDDE